MKKTITVFLAAVLCLLCAGCGSITLPERFADETTEPPVSERVVAIPSQMQVQTAFEKAIEVYGWFDLCSLDCDSADTVEHGGETYCRVLSDEVPSYEVLRTLVFDLFETTTGERLLDEDSETPPYIDVGGVLYTRDFARGSDVTKGEYELTVEQESKTSILCKVRVETLEFNDGYKEYRRVTGYEDFTYHYQLVGNRWVFTDFELFY
ncbi:MAG: hypothetical protein IKW76_12410 [Clostridia bacterium]|nr:hypothetical protein [Clostridia bacterium]